MIMYSSLRGRCFKFNKEYPIWDSEDNQIGTTAIGDIGVVVFDDIPNQDYTEVTIATGKYAGYDALALNKKDIENSTYVGIEDDKHISIDYKDKKDINKTICTIKLRK